MALRNSKKFRESQYSGSHTPLNDLNKTSYFLHSPSDLDKIRYVRYTRDVDKELRVS
jgi:hypothetical protein